MGRGTERGRESTWEEGCGVDYKRGVRGEVVATTPSGFPTTLRG